MENQKPTYEFLYKTYQWPEPGTERNCPYSGKPLQLNERNPGYNGKPWTCPQCIHYFSEEELNNWEATGNTECEYTRSQQAAEAADQG